MSEERGTMREDQEVELLCRVNLFESLSKEEIRVLSVKTLTSVLGKVKPSTLPGNTTASSSSSKRVRCASTEQKPQESSPSKWWMQGITLKGVPARLASLILFLIESEGLQIPGEIRIPTRYTHEHLGTMIGANREAVTRAFGRLQDDGALQVRRRLIYVDDVEALERVAGRLLEEEGEGLS